MKKIEELISQNGKEVNIDGISIPGDILKKLSNEGYVNIETDKNKQMVLVWATDRAANFTVEQLLERYAPASNS